MNERRYIRGLAGCSAIAIALLPVSPGPSSPVSGDDLRVRVSPSRLELRLSPGERAVRPIELVNEANETVEVTVRLADWTMAGDGTISLEPPGSTDRSAAELVRVLPERIRLPSGGRGEVVVIVAAPAGPASVHGTRWTSILFELPDVVTVEDDEPLRLATRLSTVVYVTPRDAVSANPTLTVPRGPLPSPILGADVSNPGETARRYSLRWVVSDRRGATAAELARSDQLILPWGRLRYRLPVPASVPAGEYQVCVTLTPGTGPARTVHYQFRRP